MVQVAAVHRYVALVGGALAQVSTRPALPWTFVVLDTAPTGHTLTVREARASVGAGFVYPICGEMRTMPGLGTKPAASIIDFDDNGEIIGLS